VFPFLCDVGAEKRGTRSVPSRFLNLTPRASFNRPAARVTDAKGHAVVASTKIRRPSTRSTVIEHLESTPRRGPFRSEIRTITRRIRLSKRRSARDSRWDAYSRSVSVVSCRPARITNAIGSSIVDPPCRSCCAPVYPNVTSLRLRIQDIGGSDRSPIPRALGVLVDRQHRTSRRCRRSRPIDLRQPPPNRRIPESTLA
jgi:hypothetical protein